MKRPRCGSLLVAVAVLLASGNTRAEERSWLGPGIGIQTVPDAMIGDAPTIMKGLGLSTERQGDFRIFPQLSIARDIDVGDRHAFSLEGSVRWFADSISATSPVRYRARRDVVPFSVLARIAVGGGETRFLLGIGPTLALTRFSESGWLGDGAKTEPAFGAVMNIGARTQPTPALRMTYLLFAEYLRLPSRNVLIRDGGDAWMMGLSFGLDFAL